MCRLDRVFSGGDAGCKTLFSDVVAPLVDGLLAGGSASVIAYGQSGSGKSRVMGFADTAGDTGGSGNGGGVGGSAAGLAGAEAKHGAGAAAGPSACRQDGDAAAASGSGWAGAVLLRAAVHLFEQIDELQQRDSDVQVGTKGTRHATRIARQYCSGQGTRWSVQTAPWTLAPLQLQRPCLAGNRHCLTVPMTVPMSLLGDRHWIVSIYMSNTV